MNYFYYLCKRKHNNINKYTMKRFNSIIRTLCLVALLCLTSENAFAYKIYDSGDINVFSGSMGSDKIFVVTEDVTVDNCEIDNGYALVILPGVTVTVNLYFINSGTIYVFGILDCTKVLYNANGGTIYMSMNEYGPWGQYFNPTGNNENAVFPTLQKVPAKAPTSTQNGWKEYWEAKIVCGDDSYPMGNYEQDNTSTKIEDLDAWKAGDGKLTYNTPTKIDGQQPGAENSYVGWKDYYEQVCTTSTGSNYTFYAEDEAFTKPITDLAAWKKGDGMKYGTKMGSQYYIIEKQNDEYVYNDNLTFADKDAYQSKYDFTVNGDLTYTRNFGETVGKWQCWYMPFDAELSVLNDANIDAAEIAGILLDENDNTVIAFKKMKTAGSVLKANTPYVVRASTASVELKFENKEVSKSDEKSFNVQSAYETFTFKGNYASRHIDACYTMNKSGEFQKMGNTTELQPMRFAMTIATRTDGPYRTSASAKEIIRLTVLGEDEQTGITSYENENENDNIYNLQGRKVTSIQSGHIYIMNGKRFIAK